MHRGLQGRWVTAMGLLTLLLAGAYGVTLLPGVRPVSGYDPALDGWLNSIVDGAVVLLLVLRGLAVRRERAAWLFLAAGLASALAGSAVYYAQYRDLEPIPSPSWADLGWLGFYPLVYVALLLVLRARVQRLLSSVWMDGLLAGLTAAAVTAAYLRGAAVPPAAGTAAGIAATVAYPIADLLLLGFVVAALTIAGHRGDLVLWLLGAGLATLVLTDAVYAAVLAEGRYVAGGPLDLGWLAGRVFFAGAALLPMRRGHRGGARPEGVALLAVPAVCGAAVLLVLFHGTWTRLPETAVVLAVVAGGVVIIRTAMTFREVRDLATVRRQAHTDELTGLANRRSFHDSLVRLAAQVRTGGSLAVLILDLDRFKEVNDALGHATGDELLHLVGRRLRSSLPEHYLLARLGGDEYAVLLRDVSAAQAEALARQLRQRLREPVRLGAMSLTIDASVGVALAPFHSSAADELLQLADLAMYAAKTRQAGVLTYDEGRDGFGRHRLELVEELREGIGRGQLVVHYQPQVHLPTMRVTAVEALVRWQHPTRGLLAPAQFIDLAESCGLMAPLTLRVVDDVVAQCGSWRGQGLNLGVAVNVSPSTLIDEDFPRHVAALLTSHSVPAAALALEVTEAVMLKDRERAVTVLTQLSALGTRLSVDDYGTGYSSLAYLSDLPVSELKLDRAFISAMTSEPRSREIVASTASLARALRLDMVAEGVEDEATLRAVTDAGCDLAQGFLFSPAVPAAQVPAAVHRIEGPVAGPRVGERQPRTRF
jgi:diguanylate cyclase (GGDEF)-like protein